MKVLIINEVLGHTSTGKICAEIAEQYEREGDTVKVAYGRDDLVPDKYRKFGVRIGSDLGVKISAIQTRLLDNHGLTNKNATRRFIKWAEEYNPDLLWLHNLHGYYINYEILFQWIKTRPEMKVKWTLHDCWSFTGHCTHFTAIKCNKWEEQCFVCPQKKCYPASLLIDSSKNNYIRKKNAFTRVNNLTIITPSNWLADKISQSFLKEYPIEVHHNTINREIFKPTPSDFREKYSLQGKTIILGVANVWNERKGLYDFYKLAQMLDERYVIVLVGLTENQMAEIPKNIIGLKKTDTQHELAAIYTAADLLVSPSVEETFGMTPIEAKGCGTKSIVYQETACEETVGLIGGIAVPQDVNAVYEAITGEKWGGIAQFKAYRLIVIKHTRNQYELAQIYTAADYFVNMTYEDTYPTVNLEAVACGTRVITYNTGGSAETLGETK